VAQFFDTRVYNAEAFSEMEKLAAKPRWRNTCCRILRRQRLLRGIIYGQWS